MGCEAPKNGNSTKCVNDLSKYINWKLTVKVNIKYRYKCLSMAQQSLSETKRYMFFMSNITSEIICKN